MTGDVEVVAGIAWREDRFLAIRRPEGKPLAGYWEFPGGKVEPGESHDMALVREFEEELAVTPRQFEFWRRVRHVYDHASVRLSFFTISTLEGEPSPREGHALAWLTPQEAAERPFLEADTEIVRLLEKQECT
jgi:8-oxo-dGTP diphosphatase